MSAEIRKVMVLSGKRGGYGAMKPMLRLLRDSPEFTLQLVLTDQHISSKFGQTIREVEQEFDVTAVVDMEQKDDLAVSRSEALGLGMQRMSRVLDNLSPDICVFYGDRGEVLAAALAATVQGFPIAHLQGGDVSGSVDEQMRHAITKLSHLHFPSNEQSAKRIRKMGEEDWRIHVVGDNHIDLIVAGEYHSEQEVAAQLNLDLSKPIIVVLQHSETTNPQASYEQMTETLCAVRKTGHQAVVVYPCSDPGYNGILRAIEELALPPQFQIHKNLDASLFWGLLNKAAVMVGNSSAGLIETPSFNLPAVNVGRRQEGRLHSENVIHVPEERDAIFNALDTVVNNLDFLTQVENCFQPYGNGQAGQNIVSIISKVALDSNLMVKRMVY
jgi:GDP/UDP-N,N'-diacetylbacillosamine 2-epimerase (hydrolysing)